jgi:2-polyprenyl-3-methyl-5-hydroxy-6-metoxy-1,4-benzoquinol methylase
MGIYRSALLAPGFEDIRSSIIDDLSTYYEMPADECVQRCINWEAWSVQEWQRKDRQSPEALAEFYHTTRSWSFDLLWYAYLQAEGYLYPVSVGLARTVPRPSAPGALRHLDFGSGIGATAQLFRGLGYESHLADISTTLLDFARYRLGRRGEQATFIDLNTTTIQPDTYDVITAIDTLVHVPDLPATARMLHAALRPGGLLFANFDVRPATDENAWHLYSDDLPLRWQLQRAGFEPEEVFDGMITRYRRVDTSSPMHHLRGIRDAVMLRSPLRPTVRRLRAALRG